MSNREQIQHDNRINRLRIIYRFTRISISNLIAIGYLVLLSVAEYLVAINRPKLGLPLHGLILIVLLLQSSLVKEQNQHRFLLALSLAPLIRLISLLMPLNLFVKIFWYLVVAIPLFVTAFLISRIAGITKKMAGLVVSFLPLQFLISLSGLFLGYFEYVILRPAPLVSALRWELIWLPTLILLVFTGFLEELIFRGIMQSTALPYMRRYAIPYVAAVFAVLHLGYRSVLDFLFVFGVALFFGYIVKYSGSILGVTIAHGVINILLYLIFPFILIVPSTSQKLSSLITPVPKMAIISTSSSFIKESGISDLTATVSAHSSPSLSIKTGTPTVTSLISQTQYPAIQESKIPAITSRITWPNPTLSTTPPSLIACSKVLPPRLIIGREAEVTVKLNLREKPGMDSTILDANQAGSHLRIIGGPVCIPYREGAYRWWQLKSSTGLTGWSSEGSLTGTTYFLSPVP